MEIRIAKNDAEVKKAYLFLNEQLYSSHDKGKYTLAFFKEHYRLNPQLMIIASDKNEITGCAFGWEDNTNVTLGALCVDINQRRRGIGLKLLSKLEENAKKSGFKRISLVAVEDAVGFYVKAGFEGTALVQSNIDSIDELLSICEEYEIAGTNIYNGNVSQLFIKIPLEQRNILSEKFNSAFPESNVSIMFGKQL